VAEDETRGGRLEPAHLLAETLGGSWSDGRRYLVIDRSYGPGHRHGNIPIMDCLPPWPRLGLLGARDVPHDRLLFIDLETTGLAGGAGTYAFLVGCAWFSGATFRIRQFFLSSYAAERALLGGLAEVAGGITGVVSFNGKSFDLPLIETRYLLHRMETPFAGLPHVDMLHPARRLWRAEEDEAAGTTASCRLNVLEQALCGVVREGDVPGFEIPARYFQYVRTGDPRPLERVFEHNRLDLISLALLMARASQLLDEGPAGARTAREALGLGRLYDCGGLADLARQAYARAIDLGGDFLTQAEALRCYAVLCRRQRRFAEAAGAWQGILDLRRCPPHVQREATEALAVHHEHRLRDLRSARQFALQSLRLHTAPGRQHAVRHRLARLERKLGTAFGPPDRGLSLFPTGR
jgi:uncharacterized protein YprB with RNaseH-like and TPR domain